MPSLSHLMQGTTENVVEKPNVVNMFINVLLKISGLFMVGLGWDDFKWLHCFFFRLFIFKLENTAPYHLTNFGCYFFVTVVPGPWNISIP